MKYDLVIRNGTVVDGSGQPRFRADVGVVGDRIEAVGRIREAGVSEVDAEGMIVAPGFIEVHSHMDAQVFWDPLGTCPAWHGVTTSIMGNCGFTLAPCREKEVDLCLRSIERAEDMSRDVLAAGIQWRWETFPEYLDVVERLPKGINYAGYIGHSALRAYVMGERAFTDLATENDLSAMRREVEAAMHAGAIGFSTSRSSAHQTVASKPVASRVGNWDEVRSLVGVMTELGTGVFEITLGHTLDPAQRAEHNAALRDLAVESGRPLTFILANAPHYGEAWKEMLAMVDETFACGGRMTIQALARQVQTVLGFKSHLPFDQLSGWRDLRAKPLPEQAALLRDGALRAKLAAEAMSGPYGSGAVGGEARPPDWGLMKVFDSPIGPYRSVADVARECGKTPAELLIDLSLESGFEQYFIQPYANHNFADVLQILSHPAAVVGGSDSGAHVSQILDSSTPTFFLAHWVGREKAFTLEQGIRKLTFDPALVWGLQGRGLVAQGMIADLVVFDPQKVGPGMPTAEHDLPAGGKRLKQKATGMTATVVAGEVLLRDGEHTGALPGRLLRGPLAQYR